MGCWLRMHATFSRGIKHERLGMSSPHRTEEWLTEYQKRMKKPFVAGPDRQPVSFAPVRAEKRIAKLEPSRLEILFAQQIALLELPEPVQQYAGAVPGRKYRIDFAWPERKCAVEVQGMAHRIKARFKADTEKMSLLVVHGWRVLPVSGDDVRSGRAVQWAATLLGLA